jgi:hypothetical protein
MEKDISIFTCFRGRTTRDQAWQEKGRQRIACWPVFACHACVTVVIEVISKVCAVYSISFSSTQRLGGHIPQDPEAHNKSKTQTTQSLTRSIPSLSRLYHQKYSRRPAILDIDSAWSRACIHSIFLAHCTHLPRHFTLVGRSVAHFPPRLPIHRTRHQLLPRRALFSPARRPRSLALSAPLRAVHQQHHRACVAA